MSKMYKLVIMLLALMLLLVSGSVFAQGMTTAAISGTITGSDGENLPGANIVAVHEPSGTQYGVTSRPDGKYSLLRLRTGGPYTLTVSFVGFTSQKKEDIYLQLGQNLG